MGVEECLLTQVILISLLAVCPSEGEGQTGVDPDDRYSSYGGLVFTDKEEISPGTFPPFITSRTYDSARTHQGVLGVHWFCWPFDATVEQVESGQTEVLSVPNQYGARQLFIRIEENLFAPTEPAKIETISLQKTPKGYTLIDLLIGRLVFDNAGRIAQVSDTRGNKLDITRDSDGIPTAVTVYQPQKVVYVVSCDSKSKRLVRISTPDGRRWQYEYDPQGNLVRVIDDKNCTLGCEYEAGQLTRRANSLGGWTSYQYDERGKLAEVNRNGRRERREYEELSSSGDWMMTVTDPIGRISEYRFLGSKRQEVFREEDGNIILRRYDDHWQLEHISSVRDGVTSVERDEAGRPVTIIDPLNRITQLRYDNALGLPSMMIDYRGQVQRFEYNAHGQLRSHLLPDGREILIRYNRFGLPLQVDDSLGETASFRYGVSGRLENVENERFGRHSQAAHEARTNLSDFLKPPALRNVPVSQRRRDLIRTLDEVLTASPVLNNGAHTFQTPKGSELTCKYDVFGNVIDLHEDKVRLAEFLYDPVDRLVEIRHSKVSSERFEYNANDQVVRYVNPAGMAYEYEYDLKGNLLHEILPNGEEHNFEYDEHGRLVSAFDSFWHDLFTYDNRGRLVQVGRLTPTSNGPEVLVTYAYDKNSRLASVLFASGIRYIYEYNEGKTLETIRFEDKKLVVQYDRHGRRRALYFPGGTKAEYSYTEEGGVSRVAIQDAAKEKLASQFCQYEEGHLVKVLSQTSEGQEQYLLTYSEGGELENILLSGRAIDGVSSTDLRKSYDAFRRLRLTGQGQQFIEYIYDLNRVVQIESGGSSVHFMRSSDGMICGAIADGKLSYVVQSALPDHAFVFQAKQKKVKLCYSRDSVNPHFVF